VGRRHPFFTASSPPAPSSSLIPATKDPTQFPSSLPSVPAKTNQGEEKAEALSDFFPPALSTQRTLYHRRSEERKKPKLLCAGRRNGSVDPPNPAKARTCGAPWQVNCNA
jgi:hypothetical protein